MSHNHGKMGSNRANETIIKRGSQGGAAVTGRGKLVAAVAAGMLSAPKEAGPHSQATQLSVLAAYCRGEKGGAPQYFNHDMEMAISKDVKSLNSNELNNVINAQIYHRLQSNIFIFVKHCHVWFFNSGCVQSPISCALIATTHILVWYQCV